MGNQAVKTPARRVRRQPSGPSGQQVIQVGREIRRRREMEGTTLEEMSARIGISPNYIGSVEKGWRDPSLSTIFALARGLNVLPGELIVEEGGPSPAGLEAARLLFSLPPKIRGPLLEVLYRYSIKEP